MQHPTNYRFRHRRGNKVIWASGVGEVDIALHSQDYAELLRAQEFTQNALTDEGEEDILDVYFRGASGPASGFFLGLCNDTLAETDTLSTLTGEPSTGGYARQAIARSSGGFPTLALDSGDYQTVSTTETFTASGASIGPVNTAFLATSSDNSGLLVAYAALSTSRTLADTDSLDVDITIKLS